MIKSFVSSDQCLTCRGCCIFDGDEAEWLPHISTKEFESLGVGRRTSDEAPDTRNSTPNRHILPTVTLDGCRRCVFLNPSDHRCRAYEKRPFECRLYPFLLSNESGRLRVYAHLGCPFVSQERESDRWRKQTEQLRSYFSKPQTREHVLAHAAIFPDYSSFSGEIEWLFDVEPADDGLLSRREEVDAWLGQRSRALSLLSFATLFAWKEHFKYQISEVDGNLCVYAGQNGGTFLFWPPLGKTLSSVAIKESFRRMRGVNNGNGVTRMENVSREDAALFDPSRHEITLQGYEFVYYRKDLEELKGVDYKSRRHDINLMLRQFSPDFRPFTADDLPGCLDLFEHWLDRKMSQHNDEVYRQMLLENRSVHQLLLENSASVGLEGRVAVIDGRIAGYTFGHAVNDEVFCDLLEVADPDVPGLAAFLFRELCADDAVKPFKFVNAMDAFEMPNVAQAKLSYRPSFLEPVYAVSERLSC
jgi:Fe-S-cluster containining protein